MFINAIPILFAILLIVPTASLAMKPGDQDSAHAHNNIKPVDDDALGETRSSNDARRFERARNDNPKAPLAVKNHH